MLQAIEPGQAVTVSLRLDISLPSQALITVGRERDKWVSVSCCRIREVAGQSVLGLINQNRIQEDGLKAHGGIKDNNYREID